MSAGSLETMLCLPIDLLLRRLKPGSQNPALAGPLALTLGGHANVLIRLRCFRNRHVRHFYLAEGEPLLSGFDIIVLKTT